MGGTMSGPGLTEAPMTYGSSGGLLWPLRAPRDVPRGGGGGHTPGGVLRTYDRGNLSEDAADESLASTWARTRRVARGALRLRATRPPEVVARCGRRLDPREWGEEEDDELDDGNDDEGGELTRGDSRRKRHLLALASSSYLRDRRRERRRDRRRDRSRGRSDDGIDDEDDPGGGSTDDEGTRGRRFGDDAVSDDESSDESAWFDDDAPGNPRLDREAFDAAAALLHGQCPLGIPRGVLRGPLLDAHVAPALDGLGYAASDGATPRGPSAVRLGNAMAVTPWPGIGDDGCADDVMLAHTGGEGASEVFVTRVGRSDGSGSGSGSCRTTTGSWRVPTRCATQPVMQLDLARMPAGWFGCSSGDEPESSTAADHVFPPALLAVRDACGVSLLRVGGGHGLGDVREAKPRGRRAGSAAAAAERSARTEPRSELMWSAAPRGSRPSHVALSPHGVPELLVALGGGALHAADVARGGGSAAHVRRLVSRRGDWGEDAWTGCSYGAHPRTALCATAKEVTLVDLRAPPPSGATRGNALAYYAAAAAGGRGWGALAGPPPPPWSPASFARDGGPGGGWGGITEHGFALACDRSVVLHDLRRPTRPVLSWRHGASVAPAWLRVEPTAPWRGPGRGAHSIRGGMDATPGAMIVAGSPRAGDVIAFEFADEGTRRAARGTHLLCAQPVAALSAGVRVPLPDRPTDGAPDTSRASGTSPGRFGEDGWWTDDRWRGSRSGAGPAEIQGFALVPPADAAAGGSPSPGAVYWATESGEVRRQPYASPGDTSERAGTGPGDRVGVTHPPPGTPAPGRGSGGGAFGVPTAGGPLVFDASGHPPAEVPLTTSIEVNPLPATPSRRGDASVCLNRTATLPSGVSPEDVGLFGAAGGVFEMDPGRVLFGEETARAAARGAERAAASIAGASSSHVAPEEGDDAPIALRLRMMPRVFDFVAAGVTRETSQAAAVEGSAGAKDEVPAEVAARAATLVRRFAGGGWGLTAHEMAQAAGLERGDAPATGLVRWRASRSRHVRRARDVAREKNQRENKRGTEEASSSAFTGAASISALTRTSRDEDDGEEVATRSVQRDHEPEEDEDEDGDDSLCQRRVDPIPAREGWEAVPVAIASPEDGRSVLGDGDGSVGLLTALIGPPPIDADGTRARRPRYLHTKWLRASARWLRAFEAAAVSPSATYGALSRATPRGWGRLGTARGENTGGGQTAANIAEAGSPTPGRAGSAPSRRVGGAAVAALEAHWAALERGDVLAQVTMPAALVSAGDGAGAGAQPRGAPYTVGARRVVGGRTTSSPLGRGAVLPPAMGGYSRRMITPERDAEPARRRAAAAGRGGSTPGGGTRSPMPPPPPRGVTTSGSQPDLGGVSAVPSSDVGGVRGLTGGGTVAGRGSSQPAAAAKVFVKTPGKAVGKTPGKTPGTGKKKRRREEGFL